MTTNPSLDEVPDEIRDYIQSLRQESAKYRVERNELRTKYEEVAPVLQEANDKITNLTKVQSDYEKTLTENSDLQKTIGRMNAAGKVGIFTEYERLKGDTPEDWEKDAAELAERFGTKTPRLPKDEAAGKPPRESKDDPITQAFRKAGVM